MSLENLLERIANYNPNADLNIIKEAYQYASDAHKGQYRVSGELFIVHPLEVAKILTELELDVDTIVAGLLHDVVEDTEITIDELKQHFGEEIAMLVDGVTKLSKIEVRSKEERQAENLRKMFLAMAKDIRVILIKLADRTHNMRTLKHLSVAKQKEIAKETLEIFAPLAHRLGISRIKWELEDNALHYLEPDIYYQLVDQISIKRKERENLIKEIIGQLEKKLDEVGIKADIQGRPKHFYSIYQKMQKQSKGFEEIYDLTAVRVIVDNVKDCYGTLGTIHTLWKPIPGRFKDYIAMPKPNMYQSLHTTVVGPKGERVEIQIRTWEMHRTAEYGIAAHWIYKQDGKSGKDKSLDQKLSWLRQILEWQHELKDAREFMDALKINLFEDEVFIFTPKGDVIDLPVGSVPIDFAYRIHTDIGNRCVGAKVNGKIVPFDYKLKTGDIVEVLTSKAASGPSRDWLNIVKTSQARSKIKQWFRKEQKDVSIAKGREALEKELRRSGYEQYLKGEKLEEIAKKVNIASEEELYAAIGYGGITLSQVVVKIRDEIRQEKKKQQPQLDEIIKQDKNKDKKYVYKGVSVRGVDNILIRLSKCCNPVPGDEIIGYITRGRGVSIHRKDCPNIPFFNQEEHRLLEVSWETKVDSSYFVQIQVSALDRPQLLSDLMGVLNESRNNISAMNARTNKDKVAIIDLTVEIKGAEQLHYLKQRLRRVKDVFSVERVVLS